MSAEVSFYIDQFRCFQSKICDRSSHVSGPMLSRAREPAMTYPAPTTAESEAAPTTAEATRQRAPPNQVPPRGRLEGMQRTRSRTETTPEAVERRHRAGDLTCSWRRTRLQFVARWRQSLPRAHLITSSPETTIESRFFFRYSRHGTVLCILAFRNTAEP